MPRLVAALRAAGSLSGRALSPAPSTRSPVVGAGPVHCPAAPSGTCAGHSVSRTIPSCCRRLAGSAPRCVFSAQDPTRPRSVARSHLVRPGPGPAAPASGLGGWWGSWWCIGIHHQSLPPTMARRGGTARGPGNPGWGGAADRGWPEARRQRRRGAPEPDRGSAEKLWRRGDKALPAGLPRGVDPSPPPPARVREIPRAPTPEAPPPRAARLRGRRGLLRRGGTRA